MKRKKVVVIRRSRPQGCDLCGIVAELRPYGPKGEWICFNCGMKNEETTRAAFNKRIERGDPWPYFEYPPIEGREFC